MNKSLLEILRYFIVVNILVFLLFEISMANDFNDAEIKHIDYPSWFKKTNFSRLPALMFFDEKGNNVLETDTLVLGQRMMNSLNFVIEKAYKKDWSYQQFARAKGIERNIKRNLEN